MCVSVHNLYRDIRYLAVKLSFPCPEALCVSFLAQRVMLPLLKSMSLSSGPAPGDLSPRSFRLLMSPLMCSWQLSPLKVPVFQQHQKRFKSNNQNQLKQITKHTRRMYSA